MKIKFYYAFGLLILLFFYNNSNAQNANTSLSNLTSPTKVNVNLLPDKNAKRNLGDSSKGWKGLYLDSVLYLYGKPFIKIPDALSWNTIVGINAMHDDDFSYGNTALGYEVMYENTDGGENTAVGSLALLHNKTGYSNTAMGYDALNQNRIGNSNVAIGEDASYSDTSGSYNTAIGFYALEFNTRGSENVAVGDSAAYAQNTGLYMNTAIGARALRYNVTGTANTACGSYALYHNKETNNSAFGNSALYNNSTGFNNTAIGNGAGANVTNGSNNTFIGCNANCGSGGHLTNSVALGSNASVTTNNTVRIGDGAVTSIGGYSNWSNVSDGRIKKNIKSNVPGLSFIKKLNPITYNLDLNAADKIIERPETPVPKGEEIQPSAEDLTARKEKEQIVYTGFIAQDVEKAAKELNYDFSGVDAAKNDHDLYGLRYSEFVVPLVKAVQELSVKNDSLQKQSDVQQKINTELQNQINELKAIVNKNAQSNPLSQSSSITLNNVSLDQTIPNPFNHTTTIHYTLPQNFSSAQILITDNNGKTLKQINVSGIGKGSVNIDASTLSSGTYNYSLIVDGKLIGTKQMVLTKQKTISKSSRINNLYDAKNRGC